MSNLLEGTKRVNIAKTQEHQFIWTSEKVQQWLDDYQNGVDNKWGCPFENREIGIRKGNLKFQYTEEEIEEIKRCKNDINYFANKYCFAMTDEGLQKIDLYQFQRDILSSFQENRYNILLASRQVGKCTFGSGSISSDNRKIPIHEIYFENLEKKRKLTIFEKIKRELYRLLDI